MHKTIRIIDNFTDYLLYIPFCILILIGIYIGLDAHYVFTHAASGIAGKTPDPVTEEIFMEVGPESVAWLTIYDTSIDYPIMQADNNIKYLNTAPDGSYSLVGSIFLDAQNDSKFIDEYNLIYGHHMQEGYMFGALDAFRDKTYFEEHDSGKLTVRKTKKEYDFIPKAFMVVDAHENLIFDVDKTITNEERILYIKEKSTIYEDIDVTDTIVALSTCKDPGTTERTILIGIIQER